MINEQNFTGTSVLRYPGGKSKVTQQILKEIVPYLKSAGKTARAPLAVSPFCGGCSVELALASCGFEVKCYDIFKPLINFWQELQAAPKELAAMVGQMTPIDSGLYTAFQTEYHAYKKKKQAAVFYILNKYSFNGMGLASGWSQQAADRASERYASKLALFTNSNISFDTGDWRIIFNKYPAEFLFLDPPYPNTPPTIYGEKNKNTVGISHKSLLSSLLARESKWVMCYPDSEELREYEREGCRIKPIQIPYSMSDKKYVQEFLIFSNWSEAKK